MVVNGAILLKKNPYRYLRQRHQERANHLQPSTIQQRSIPFGCSSRLKIPFRPLGQCCRQSKRSGGGALAESGGALKKIN